MKALSFKEPWLNSTLEKLLGLSASTKRALIRALENSMLSGNNDPALEKEEQGNRKLSKRFWSAYGAWDSPESAAELIRSIRETRYDRDREVDL